MSIAESLAESHVFRGLPFVVLQRLAERSAIRLFPAGAVLMRQGEMGASVYVIARGRVRVERAHADLREPLTLAELGPREIVGEAAVLDGEPRSATVIAVEETETVELDADSLAQALLMHPQVSAALLRTFSRRLRSADELAVQVLRRAWRPDLEMLRDLD